MPFQDIPVTTACVNAAPGEHVLAEQTLASSKGVVITGGTLGGVGLPAQSVTGGASPILSAFSYATASTMSAGGFETLVSVTLNSEGVAPIANETDAEIAGWVTIGNPNAVAATLTLRQITDGAVERPRIPRSS